MRRWLLTTLLMFAPVAASAQVVERLQFGRPDFDISGLGVMPMLFIDEAALQPERYQRIPFPKVYWDEMRTCLFKQGIATTDVGEPPDILVVPPLIKTFRVHDLTTDSVFYAVDSTFTGEVWSPPTVGYSLVKSNLILAAWRFHKNKYMMRHEALHFLLWRQKRIPGGHPPKYFGPCDADYE